MEKKPLKIWRKTTTKSETFFKIFEKIRGKNQKLKKKWKQ